MFLDTTPHRALAYRPPVPEAKILRSQVRSRVPWGGLQMVPSLTPGRPHALIIVGEVEIAVEEKRSRLYEIVGSVGAQTDPVLKVDLSPRETERQHKQPGRRVPPTLKPSL